jgi:arsenate reductase-like glutaredoxin family protein
MDYEFVDFKKTPPTVSDIEKWKEAFGDYPVNTKGTTYKKLKDEKSITEDDLKDVEKEIDLEIKNLNSEIDNIFKEKEKEILKI